MNGRAAVRHVEARPDSARRRLLVVDDDPDVALLVEASLAGRALEIDAALSGAEALEKAAARPPDLILLDVVLPDQSGLEVLRSIVRQGLDVPVIVITSHTTMDVAIEAMKEGAYDFLAKPLRPLELERLVDAAVAEPAAGAETGDSPRGGAEADGEIVGRSPEIIEVYKTIGRVAQTNATVLVVGESGTGKELVARVLHRNSRRGHGPFLTINCAAIPESLLESELFGHEQGAFTGAIRRTRGKVERADGGTLFLDEIGEISPALQGKLLRLLDQREIEPVGGSGPIPVDVRIVAATNRNLEAAVAAGEFREDLYYRVAVVTIALPPLRRRKGDIRLLTDHFVRRLADELGRTIERVEPEVYRRLEAYDWPGNVRELRNAIERSLVLGRGPTLRASHLPPLPLTPVSTAAPTLQDLAREGLSLAEIEKQYIARILREMEWNQSRTAGILGIDRNTLRRKIRQYGLEPRGRAS